MSLYDYLRRAFMPPSRADQPGFRNPIWEEDSEDDDDELYEEFRQMPLSPFGFRIFTDDVMDTHKYFEQQMEEMWKNFHSSLFGSDLLQLPDLSDMEQYDDTQTRSGAYKYLKPNYELNLPKDSSKQDTDIDGRISPGDLRKLFPSDGGDDRVSSSQVPTRIFGHSVITRIVRTSDGRLEEEKRVRASDGREEVSLTRQMGDQKYKVITKKDSGNGLTDTTEELINLDEDKLDEFNRKWEEKKRTGTVPPDPSGNSIVKTYDPPSDQMASIIHRLFEKWFK